MTHEYGESRPHIIEEQQRGWPHIPMNDHDRPVSPISSLSTPSTAQDQTQSYGLPRSHEPEHLPSADRKGMYDPQVQEIVDPNARQQKRGFVQDWWQEIGSAIFSMLCTVAIVVILYKIDGTRLSEWTIAVSPNAVISILSTALKAGMILPVAECISQLKWIHLQSSKSHLEQLQIFDNASRGPAGSAMFFVQAKRAPPVSYLGCLIVVLALALDPFAQQILQYLPLKTAVPHLNSTVSQSQVYDWGTTNVFRGNSVNCTFPPVTTLGVCSSCQDVTQLTQVECKNETYSYYQGQPLQFRFCYYRLPGSPGNPLSVNLNTPNPTLNISVNPPPIGIVNLTEVNDGDAVTTIMRMGIVRWDRVAEAEAAAGAQGNATSWVDTMTAQECAFSLCPWSFTDWSYADGSLKRGTTMQSKFQQPDVAELDFGPPPYYILNAADPDFPDNQTFTLSGNDYSAIKITLDSLWDGTTGGTASLQLWNSLYEANRNISATLEAMATGMTYNMMKGPNATLAVGEVLETQTFIYVHWPWLSLSILTVVASVAILLFTIIKTRAAHQRAWKSSLVPLLYADWSSLPTGVGGESWGEEHKEKRKATISSKLSF